MYDEMRKSEPRIVTSDGYPVFVVQAVESFDWRGEDPNAAEVEVGFAYIVTTLGSESSRAHLGADAVDNLIDTLSELRHWAGMEGKRRVPNPMLPPPPGMYGGIPGMGMGRGRPAAVTEEVES